MRYPTVVLLELISNDRLCLMNVAAEIMAKDPVTSSSLNHRRCKTHLADDGYVPPDAPPRAFERTIADRSYVQTYQALFIR